MKLKILKPLIYLILLGPFLAVKSAAAEDLVIANFEGDTYGAWVATGEAFGPGPARGTLPGQMAVDGYKGSGLVNSFFKGDATVGTLTSPPFKIERHYITFLIGGGKDAEKLSFNLMVDGRVVRTATGPNDRPGGSETLMLDFWDVVELEGKMGVLQINDQATGGWGHINVDHILQTERKPPSLSSHVQRTFKITKQFLHLPIKNGAPRRVVKTLLNGQTVVRNDMELANGTPDWWAAMDVSSLRGKTITLEVDRLPEDSTAMSSIEQSNSIKNDGKLYGEPLRGQLHFSPRRGWNNDPNGMVYYRGEYHLFFQHNPYGWGWGNMHWGHAVSKDMIHWQELGDALAPDEFGPMFSGSAVVDWNNTSGFGSAGKPPLVLIYTAAGNPTVQCIAYSIDGRRFTKFGGNPVVKEITSGNRDPKVLWHEPSKHWVMVLYVGLKGGKHTIHFFTSPNLRDWKLASVTEGIPGTNYLFECPDFFELPIDGNTSNKKWVLMAANTEYAIGTFDGTSFRPELTKLPGQRGRGFYAPQTFSDLPHQDGRRIQIGWFQTETKGMAFNQSMTVPLELKLTQTLDGPRLTYSPIRELKTLRSGSQRIKPFTLTNGGSNPLIAFEGELVELNAEFSPEGTSQTGFNVRGAHIVYDASKNELVVNNQSVAVTPRNGKVRLRVFCDTTGLEVFAHDGLIYIPMPFQPKGENRSIVVSSKGGDTKFTSLEVFPLKSIWSRR